MSYPRLLAAVARALPPFGIVFLVAMACIGEGPLRWWAIAGAVIYLLLVLRDLLWPELLACDGPGPLPKFAPTVVNRPEPPPRKGGGYQPAPAEPGELLPPPADFESAVRQPWVPVSACPACGAPIYGKRLVYPGDSMPLQ